MPADTQPSPRSVGNALLALLFLSISAVNALQADVLGAGVWFSLGLALVVLGNEATPWAKIPLWRRVLGAALALLGVVLIAANLWIDFTT
ncbi:MAG: hypothetical protein K2P58_04350 [Hyphomonadaceae bacterium]|nr:hypothetical protein [Hyphomonadaceae bacterium]